MSDKFDPADYCFELRHSVTNTQHSTPYEAFSFSLARRKKSKDALSINCPEAIAFADFIYRNGGSTKLKDDMRVADIIFLARKNISIIIQDKLIYPPYITALPKNLTARVKAVLERRAVGELAKNPEYSGWSFVPHDASLFLKGGKFRPPVFLTDAHTTIRRNLQHLRAERHLK